MDLLITLMETPYPPTNYYRPVNRFYGLLQDLPYPPYTTPHYTVWQILVSKLAKVRRSGDKELILCLQTILITILVLRSLNTDILSLQTTTYRSNIKKTLQTLQKLSLRPTNLQLPITYKPSSMIKVYGLKGTNKSLLYSFCIIQYIKRTKQNRLKRKSQTRLIL